MGARFQEFRQSFFKNGSSYSIYRPRHFLKTLVFFEGYFFEDNGIFPTVFFGMNQYFLNGKNGNLNLI